MASSDEYHDSGSDEYVPSREDLEMSSSDSEESSDLEAGPSTTCTSSQPVGRGQFRLKMFRSKVPKTSTPKAKNTSTTTQSSNADRLNKSAPAASSSTFLRHQTTASSSSELHPSESPVSSALLACMQRVEKHMELIDKRVKYLTAVVERGQNEENQTKKRIKEKLTVPSHIKSAVHDGYRAGIDEKGYSWVTKDGERVMKTKSEENKEMTSYIKTFVKGLYPDTQDGVIQAGIEIYFSSIKQKNQKQRDGKMESHKNKMLRYGRKQRKLEWRKKSVQHKKGWDEAKKKKVTKSLELAYMSSEEEVDSDNETIFRVVPLPWRSEEYDSICRELDAKHEKLKSARSKRQMVKRVRGTIPSTRSKPKDVVAENSWVLKEL